MALPLALTLALTLAVTLAVTLALTLAVALALALTLALTLGGTLTCAHGGRQTAHLGVAQQHRARTPLEAPSRRRSDPP